MSNGEAIGQPPNAQEIRDLKRLATGIIRAQGNRFIKELMREKSITLGATKDDFEANLNAAIESGTLRLADVAAWLETVEGWGNQHVYLYAISSTVARQLTEPKLHQAATAAGHGKLWNASTVLAFPDTPRLTSISFDGRALRLVWQEASPGWTPTPTKDFRQEEGLDTFEYRAYRKVERRAITRFEAHKDLGLAALFVGDPIQGEEHAQAIATARAEIGKLINLNALEANRMDISVVSRNMDQRNVPSNTNPSPGIKTQKTRLASGGAYVEFAARASDRGYAEENAIRDVRNAIRAPQLPAFQGATGVFLYQPGSAAGAIGRPLRVQLYGNGDRIRLWAQMDSAEVWAILNDIGSYT